MERYTYPAGGFTGFLTIEKVRAKRKCRGDGCTRMVPKGADCLVSIETAENKFSHSGRVAVKKSFCHSCGKKLLQRHFDRVGHAQAQLMVLEGVLTGLRIRHD